MGTHPIFESDFDCLTECDRFYRVPSLCFEIRFVAVVSGTRRPPNRCEELKTTGFTCTSFPSAVGSLLSLTPRTRLSSLESQKNWDGMPNMPISLLLTLRLKSDDTGPGMTDSDDLYWLCSWPLSFHDRLSW